MKIFLDLDVLLDLLLGREPFLEDIKWILELSLNNKYNLYTSSLAIANIHYLISKTLNTTQAFDKVDKLLTFIKILNVGENEVRSSISSKFKDFEDGIQNFCALNSNMGIIITRNIKDFKHSKLSILTPKEFIVNIKGKVPGYKTA